MRLSVIQTGSLRAFLPSVISSMLLLSTISIAELTESDTGHVYSVGDWESLRATPGDIKSTAMAYSPDDNRILLYGGRASNSLLVNELWVYNPDTNVWTEKTGWNCVPVCPEARAVHSMVYDEFNEKFVVFGGYLVSGHKFETNETWTYDLATNTWTRLGFGSQDVPEPRHWGSLEYNPDDRRIYLFGGHYNAGSCPGDIMYKDVWKLNISGTPTWIEMNPAGGPEPRQSDWVYNTAENKFYLFGGKVELGPAPGTPCGGGANNRETFFNDIWRYDSEANQWTKIQEGQTSYTHYPKARRADTVYDDQNNRLTFFSGLSDGANQYGKDTWIYDFDNDRWSTMQDADMVLPPMRHGIAAAWDNTDNIMYIYGINDSTGAGNFWKLTIFTNNISVNCFNMQPVIFGTTGDDQFSGNNVLNVMYGLVGEDVMRGGGGGDFLCGAADNDTLYGEGGNDKLYGYQGNDELHGGTGDDRLRGDSGNDKLFGDDGKDAFDCGTGTDTIMDFNPGEGDTKTSDCENF